MSLCTVNDCSIFWFFAYGFLSEKILTQPLHIGNTRNNIVSHTYTDEDLTRYKPLLQK